MRRMRCCFFKAPTPFPYKNRGFSLVEVVLALGIVSFSLIGILSIFPVALDTAKDSKNETRITLIAQTIFSDLQISQPGLAKVVLKDVGNPALNDVITYPLTSFQTVYVGYDGDGKAKTKLEAADFARYTGGDPSINYAASINVVSDTTVPAGLVRVDVSVQTPPQAAETATNARRKYSFSAYIPRQ